VRPIARALHGRKRYAVPIAAIFAAVMILVVLAPAEKQIAAYNPDTQVYTFKWIWVESGLSSEISSWGVSGHGSTSPGNSLTYSTSSTVDSSPTLTWSWNGVPGYSVSGPTSGTGSLGGTTYTGTYSGSPQPPSLSSVSGSPNPVTTGGTVDLSSNANFEDVDGGTYHWSSSAGSLSSTSAANPTWSDSLPGSYTISLYISTDTGTTSTVSYTQTVTSPTTVTVASSQGTVDASQGFTLTATASGGTTPYSYQWYTGSSGSGTAISGATSSTYTTSESSSGTYDFYVEVTDSDGSAYSSTYAETVDPALGASISSSLNPSDIGQSVVFTASGSGGSGTYNNYNFYLNGGSVQSSSGNQWTEDFTSTGSNSVYVVITDSNGYSATSGTITQTVNTDPTVSISSSQNPTDVGNTVTFTSSVSGGTAGYSYSWSINGNTYTTSSASYSFTSSGTYSVSLSVTDAAGYVVTQTLDETVNSDPTVSASSSVSSADVGYSISFSSTPSGGTGPYTYSWTLNGNQLSTSQDFSYSFSSSGSYTLTVTVTDAVDTPTSASVTVTINPNPSISVSSSQNPSDVGNSVTFSSSVSGGTGTDTYLWYINGVQESTASSFSYSFSSAGTYYINVTVTDGDGHTASYSLTETVNPDPSVTINVVHNPTDVGIWATFTADITGGTGPFTYSWTVNGQVFTSSSVNYTFTSSGTYPVSLSITDANGNQATGTVSEVVNPDPTVQIGSEYAVVDQGISNTFSASVSGGTGPFNYTWTLGAEILNYSQNFHMNFSSLGTYQVNLSVVDSLGEVAAASYSIKVIAKPSALIEGPNRTDISTATYWEGYGSYGTAPYNYYWYLNGVNTSAGLYLHYSFPDIGSYNITLLIDDSQGSKAYAYMNVTVQPLPTVKITESISEADAGMPVYFNSSITGGTPFFNYTWTLSGVGFVGYQQDLVYSFSPGTYNVTVRVSDGSGNSASASIEIRIAQIPEVSIQAQYLNVDPNVTDAFNAAVSGGTPAFEYHWYVGGTSAGSGSSLNYSFGSPGIFSLKVVVYDSLGMEAQYVTDVTVVHYPQASIISSRTNLDANVSDQFRASGFGGIGPYGYEWIIAGHIYTNSTVSYAFISPGNYTVQLIISDSFGKDASASVDVSVYRDPSVSVTWSGKPVVSEPSPMVANVTGGIAPYAISWIFPSGQHETGPSISHVFSSSGPDVFEVQVSDQGGFMETRNFTVDVGLFVAIAANQTSGLGPLSVQFSSSVLGGSGYAYNWTFSPGHYSLVQNPSYTFPTGNYTVHFVVTSDNGAKGYANISIFSLPPPVSFIYSTDLNITQAFDFKAIPNWDASGPYGMSWSFPDGQTITGMDISYKFPVYSELDTVIATFSYGSGQTWSRIITVRMVPATPVISFTPPSVIPAGTMLSLNATATAPDSNAFSYAWNINGTSDSGQSVLYYFSHAGNYTVSVTATDSLGASATATRIIDVLPQESNSSIVLSYSRATRGPMDYYTIKVQSLDGITAVEAFLGTAMITPAEINSSYTPQGEIAYFNLTMDQGSYNSGTYGIKVVAFNNDSASNSMTMPFSVSSGLSQNPISIGTVIAFFGGLPNFLIIMLTLSGIGIAAMQLRKPPIDVVATSGGKTKTYRLDTKR